MSIIIATTDPTWFTASLVQLPIEVHVHDNASDVFSGLENMDCSAIYADFRELKDGWTGARFLREIRAKPAHQDVKLFILAETLQKYQEEWLTKLGATGVVHRSPDAVVASVKAMIAGHRKEEEILSTSASDLDRIDDHFRIVAGPLSDLHIEDVRETLPNCSSEAYIAALADSLTLKERRDVFLSLVGKTAK
jgi:hypothetical protein